MNGFLFGWIFYKEITALIIICLVVYFWDNIVSYLTELLWYGLYAFIGFFVICFLWGFTKGLIQSRRKNYDEEDY